METLHRRDIEVLGKIIKSGILKYDLDVLVDILKKFQEKYQVHENDDETTMVFKIFIIYGRVVDVSRITGLKSEKVIDILFFKKCEDYFLTLMAKYLYSISGTKFCDFLKVQVEILFNTGTLDVKQEVSASKKGV